MKKLYSSQDLILIRLLKSNLEDHGIVCLIKNEYPPLGGEIPPALACPELWSMDDEKFLTAKQIVQETIDNLTTSTSWQCPVCGESLEKQFDICWKCGASRPQ